MDLAKIAANLAASAQQKKPTEPITEVGELISTTQLVEILTPNTQANLEARFKLGMEKVQLPAGAPNQVSGVKVSSPQPLTNAEQISDKIATLQQQLQTGAPGYESMLHQIHKVLAADEDLCHILNEEQIGIIVAGLSKKKHIILTPEKVKAAGKKSSITEDDL